MITPDGQWHWFDCYCEGKPMTPEHKRSLDAILVEHRDHLAVAVDAHS